MGSSEGSPGLLRRPASANHPNGARFKSVLQPVTTINIAFKIWTSIISTYMKTIAISSASSPGINLRTWRGSVAVMFSRVDTFLEADATHWWPRSSSPRIGWAISLQTYHGGLHSPPPWWHSGPLPFTPVGQWPTGASNKSRFRLGFPIYLKIVVSSGWMLFFVKKLGFQ